MILYKLLHSGDVMRSDDGVTYNTYIPRGGLPAYQEFLQWQAQGGIPEADERTLSELSVTNKTARDRSQAVDILKQGQIVEGLRLLGLLGDE